MRIDVDLAVGHYANSKHPEDNRLPRGNRRPFARLERPTRAILLGDKTIFLRRQ